MSSKRLKIGNVVRFPGGARQWEVVDVFPDNRYRLRSSSSSRTCVIMESDVLFVSESIWSVNEPQIVKSLKEMLEDGDKDAKYVHKISVDADGYLIIDDSHRRRYLVEIKLYDITGA